MRPLRPFLLVLPLALAACDPTVGGGGEAVSLQPRTRTATFSFPCDGAAAGQPITATSTADMTFGGTGDLDGFTPSDITTARVTAATLALRLPSGATLNTLLSGVRVSLVGATTAEVATGGSLPASLSATLTANGTDVGALLRSGAFRARLDGTVVTPRATACRIDATLTFAIKVEGF